ncbi:hypothetical protein ACLOJK_031849 [Asimina triloba]
MAKKNPSLTQLVGNSFFGDFSLFMDDDLPLCGGAGPAMVMGIHLSGCLWKYMFLKDRQVASESEEDVLEEEDDDVEEEHEMEPEAPPPEPVIRKLPSASVTKDTERQLSKKELKKKELEELDAVLAELGISKKETNGQAEPCGAPEGKKGEVSNGEAEKGENVASLTESKSAKKKKKKEKSSKEARDQQDQGNGSDNNAAEAPLSGEPAEEEAPSNIDMKERLKKVASMKKKKSGKEIDAAAKAAASEAAARSARLAAAKKKEKNHYNQQPVRGSSQRVF